MTAGLAIYDTMQYVRPEICTICMGQAASMGSLLLTAGSPEMRFILPNAKAREYKQPENVEGVSHARGGGQGGRRVGECLWGWQEENAVHACAELYQKCQAYPPRCMVV